MATTEPRRPATEGTLRPETVKHYLETIFYIQFEEDRVRPGRIAEWLGLRPPTVSVTLHRLERDGWIHVESDRTVSLTDEGMALASGVVRVHRLLERWLTDVLGFDWATADNYAQEIAPGMSDAVADRLDEHLGHPSTCPHGNVIPGNTTPYGELISLAELPPGDGGPRPPDLRGGGARRSRSAPATGRQRPRDRGAGGRRRRRFERRRADRRHRRSNDGARDLDGSLDLGRTRAVAR